MATAPRSRITPDQYLALERQAEIKSEYCDGEMFAMAGASRAHNLIAGNLFRAIGNHLEGRPCEVYMSDMRVCVRRTGLYTYPDVVVVCGQPEFQDAHVDTLLNPTAIIEVLSSSTEVYDRGRESTHYRQVASLKEYVLIAQDEMEIVHFVRTSNHWEVQDVQGPDEILRLTSIGCDIPLRAIYARVEFLRPGPTPERASD